MAAMWQKWAFIASVGALNCLLGGSVGEIVAVDGGDEIARGIVDGDKLNHRRGGLPAIGRRTQADHDHADRTGIVFHLLAVP